MMALSLCDEIDGYLKHNLPPCLTVGELHIFVNQVVN